MSDQSAKPVAAVVREAGNEEIVDSEATTEGAEPTAEVANDAVGDKRAENLANLKKVGTIHFVAVVAALTLFGADFAPAKCKTSLRLCLGRVKLLKNKKRVALQALRREIAELMRAGKYDSARVRVEGVNIVKKHQKANPNMGVQGGIVDQEMPLDISNVMVFNPKAKKGERVGIRVNDDGSKERIFRSSGETVDI